MSIDDPRIDTVVAGKYLIERRIARGGMGSVYLAVHKLMNRKVAIKLLHEKLHQEDQDDVFFKRFLREARAASKLDHPNAVTIYDFGLADEIPYLAMQFIDGRNISAVLAQDGPFSIERALPLFEQICSAIQAAHELTIAHRDIKPDNVIIQTNELGKETAHVLDFGIAKAMVGSTTMVGAMTAVGKTVGTPRYMSPEQALGKEVDLRTDVYSLAIVFYEMLVGEIPFSAATPVELMYEHLNSEPKEIPSELGLPHTFQTALFKALSKSPEDRYSSPEQLIAALKHSLQAEQMSDTSFNLPELKSKHLLLGAIVLAAIISISFVALRKPGKALPNASETVAGDTADSANDANSTESQEIESKNTVVSNTVVSNKVASNTAAKKTDESSEPLDKLKAKILDDSALEAKNSVREDSVKDNSTKDPTNLDPMLGDSAGDLLTEKDTTENDTVEKDTVEKDTAEKDPIEHSTDDKDTATTQNENANKAQLSLSHENISTLIEHLGSEDRKLRIRAAIELQKRGKKPVPQLIKALDRDNRPRVRYLCAFILGKMKAQEAAPVLRKVAKEDESGMVAETAKRALQSLKR